MPRAFTDADLIQSNSGTDGTPGAGGVASTTVSLSAGATEGSTIILYLRNLSFATIADVWEPAAAEATIPVLSVYVRTDALAGETSWTLALPSGSSAYAWYVEEWANISSLPVVSTSSASDLAPTASTLSTGSTSSFTGEQFVMAVAAYSMYKNSPDGVVWPSITGYSNGFTPIITVDNGTGVATSDQRLAVARWYGPQAQDGPLSTTATFSGTLTNVTTQAALVVFRAEDIDLQPAPTILTPGGAQQ